MNKQLFVEKLNEHNRHYVSEKSINGLVSDYKEEQKKCTNTLVGIDLNDRAAVLRRLQMHKYNITKITISELNKCLEETGEELFKSLIEFYKLDDKINKLESLKQHVTDGYIKPTFKLNSAGGVSVSNPVLPFNSKEIKTLFGNDRMRSIKFNNLEEIADFLRKYKLILDRTFINYLSAYDIGRFLIVGLTLYVQISTCGWEVLPFTHKYTHEELAEITEELMREYTLTDDNELIKKQ